jgi:dolichyl-phosphate-mannose-protein mannosyltransferase
VTVASPDPVRSRGTAAGPPMAAGWPARLHGLIGSPGGATAALILVLLAAFALRALWLGSPSGSLIFDERYYVNAARTILGWPVSSGVWAGSPAGLDPNTEHPPLGKLLIAGSMLVFGDDAIGWRAPSLVAGMIALAAVYGIVRALGGSPWTAVLAVAIYALDTLSFIHGRIGTLDMMMIALVLLGAWAALRHHWGTAGVLLGLGVLVKVTAVFAVLAVAGWLALELLRRARVRGTLEAADLGPAVRLLGVFAVVGFCGLWLLDLRFTTFTSPLAHLSRMFGYGLGLHPAYSSDQISSQPWEWLVNGGQFDYLRESVASVAGYTVLDLPPTIDFHAMLNPVLIGSLVPVVLFAWTRAREARDPLAAWALVWMAASYLPLVALAVVSNRVMYIYYALPVVPGLAIATTVLLRRASLPRIVAWGYLAAMAAAFVASFPFRQVP